MALEWVLNLSCLPKESLGDGDSTTGTDVLLECLKAGNRATAIANMARQRGDSPEGKAIVLRLARANGEFEDRKVTYEELVTEAKKLNPYASECEGCPANVRGTPFGCTGVVNYPIPAAVEQWLAELLQPSSRVGGKLFLAAIRDFKYTGEPILGYRTGGLLELPQAIKKKLKAGLFSSESVTTDQLFQAIFCMRDPLDPGHCLGILLWLGSLRLDDVSIESPDQVKSLLQLKTPADRAQRTALVTHGDHTVAGVAAFDALLHGLYHAWVLDVTLWVSA
ncbi:hypothetical protein [Tuwongella immobilis]|uniref:Uncharacterized protein n=1 Tax=Tuwongella immobilis TaxID=692036 RepID=A0A6C2YTS2_9BACT|nr:hypothetical protein [Tuwongella immobilis]VIP05138.1 Uncharacterized protein OS=Uncultured methanogenic archaeon RC-I GN=UNCMA_14330 PE=4 SV=1 [Tuwongella immobilis]VTS07632.1 Uncharacterized protein OS=Uncultured methanogenic archaeon RC-I GN=UNCMA_14330 PE=4 SV=1 [Tuwongella immobilis]